MKLIIGKINASNTVGYWNIGNNYSPDIRSGDYAVVENKNDYDLIKVIGIVETSEKYEKFLVQNGVSKSVVWYYPRLNFRKD